MLAGRNGARGRICTGTGDVLNVVSLLLDYASYLNVITEVEPPARAARAGQLCKIILHSAFHTPHLKRLAVPGAAPDTAGL